MREMTRPDEKPSAEEWLETKLLEGLNSAEHASTPADWQAIRHESLAILAAWRDLIEP